MFARSRGFVLIPILALALLIAACGSDSSVAPAETPTATPTEPTVDPEPETPPSTPAPAEPTAEPSQAPEPTPPPQTPALIDWNDPTVSVSLDGTWTIQPCGPEAPMLCANNGEPAGVIELQAFPLSSLGNLQSMVDSGEADSILDAFLIDIFRGNVDDRAIGCGADYQLTEHDPAPATLAGQPAVRYGFTGVHGDGSASEMTVGYAAVIDDSVVLATAAAHDAEGCIGVDELVFTSEGLTDIAPLLDGFVATLTIPASAFPGPSA